MLKIWKISIIFVFLTFTQITVDAHATQINLRVEGRSDNSYSYFHELLVTSLANQGHQASLVFSRDLPQKRTVQLFERGELDLIWLVASKERNNKYIPIEIDITNKLIGQRILLIPAGNRKKYEKIQTLQDFRNLNKSGGFGMNWFDIKVWALNDLKHQIVDGEWRNIYAMTASQKHNIDYFSRGIIEVFTESHLHKGLEIEPRLILAYDRDFRFYLSHEKENLKYIIKDALKNAQETGLIDQLLQKHYGAIFRRLDTQNRIILKLQTPE
ncbi:hypothetical protein [Curvivirga aplysinae]|uniref:hypothetical protein n=1 Tax=Curvivirga aplysinae TaxID=2529852 RepID=UPI0012BCEA42|nr:hypothetical protein [Curvivirga aplysinae]MTI10494.1 hypothetical protein [Curvivirga aplysinae]